MKNFLLVFSPLEGRLVRCQEYASAAEALKARFEAEKLHTTSGDVEIVVLSAESRESLKRTHARYFTSTLGLVDHGNHLREERLSSQRNGAAGGQD